MKLDGKKNRIIAVVAVIVVFIGLLWFSRYNKRGTIAATAKQDAADTAANYYTYNIPGAGDSGGGSVYNFGDTVIGGNTTAGPSFDADALASKICGCMDPCSKSSSSPARLMDSAALSFPFHPSYAPPPNLSLA